MESDRWSRVQPEIPYGQQVPDEAAAARRHCGREVDAALRTSSDVEVVAGLAADEAREESMRCLRCDLTAANET
jgi:hypothetical protein